MSVNAARRSACATSGRGSRFSCVLLRTNGQGHRVRWHAVDAKDHRIGAISASQPGNNDIDLIQPYESGRDAGELYHRGKSIYGHGCGRRDLVAIGGRSGSERRIHGPNRFQQDGDDGDGEYEGGGQGTLRRMV
jgi:hypothetical protein